MRVFRFFLAGAVGLALLVVPSAAGAGPSKPRPPWVLEPVWQELTGATPAAAKPQGTLIADSGFRARPNGFRWWNYANDPTDLPNRVNTYLQGVSDKPPVNLTANEMISLFGRDQVCLESAHTKASLSCTLTPAAAAWAESISEAMGGGHCFGIAAVVSEIFDGGLAPRSLGGKGAAYSVPLRPKASRAIARAWATQVLINQERYTYPAGKVIKRLRNRLAQGRAPFVLVMRDSTGGGHAVTPTAVYRSGPGRFSIQIYDNNYPRKVRAIQVDTVANEMDYTLMTSPGEPPVRLVGEVGLIPAKRLSRTFQCPFCLSSKRTMVTFSPVVSDKRVQVNVTAPDGSAIKGLQSNAPTDPWRPGYRQSFPTFAVPAGVTFKVQISNPAGNRAVMPEVAITEGDTVFAAENFVLAPGSTDTVTFNPVAGVYDFATQKGSDPAVSVIETIGFGRVFQFQVEGVDLDPKRNVRLRLNESKGVVRVEGRRKFRDRVQFSLRQIVSGQNGTVVRGANDRRVVLPKRGMMSLRYLAWDIDQRRVRAAISGADARGFWIPVKNLPLDPTQ